MKILLYQAYKAVYYALGMPKVSYTYRSDSLILRTHWIKSLYASLYSATSLSYYCAQLQ